MQAVLGLFWIVNGKLNRGMNPNTLQYLMGHANITMTLGYYAHGTFQSAKAELERLVSWDNLKISFL